MKFAQGIISVIIIAALLGVGVLGFKWMQDNKIEPEVAPTAELIPVVEVMVAKPGSHQVEILTEGRVRAKRSSQLVAELSGMIIETGNGFEVGGEFKKGDLILKIDPRDYESMVRQREAAVTEARTALRLEKARAEQSAADWKRLRGDKPASELTLRKPQIAAAEARLVSAEVALEQANLNLSKTSVLAPYDCRIKSKMTEVGSFVAPGQAILSLFSLREREATLSLGLDELGYLKREGGKFVGVGVATESVGGQKISWDIRVTRGTGQIGERTLGGELVVEFDEAADPITEDFTTPPPGSFVQVVLQGRVLENVFTIPRRALRPDGKVMLLVDGKLQFREVNVLRNNELNLLIDRGLSAGDMVITSPLEVPIAGMKLQRDQGGPEEAN